MNIENVIGGRANRQAHGQCPANLLEGRGGDDVLLGMDGNDALFGATGNDALDGGRGENIIDARRRQQHAEPRRASLSTTTPVFKNADNSYLFTSAVHNSVNTVKNVQNVYFEGEKLSRPIEQTVPAPIANDGRTAVSII